MRWPLVWLFIPVSSFLSKKCDSLLETDSGHFLVDTIRVRIQTYPSDKPLPTSLSRLVGAPIVPKLYAGLPVALGFSVPALAVYLTTYEGRYPPWGMNWGI